MTEPIRVAMVGCGFFAQNHLNAWHHLRSFGAELVAVCDIDRVKADAAANAFSAPAFYSVEKMLDVVKPDAVDIATRMQTHKALFTMMSERGVPSIMQKPLAPSWQECQEIAELARSRHVFLAIHENFRFQAPMRRIKQIIESGELGVPSWARLTFRTGFDVYRDQPYFYNEERLAILDVGVHLLDLARFFLGEVKRVSCETQRRNPKVRAEDTATVLMRHESGAVSVVDCSYETRRMPDHFPQTLVEIEGPLGSISCGVDFSLSITSNGKTRSENAAPAPVSWSVEQFRVVQESVLVANAHFLDCLRFGQKASTDIEDNLKTHALVEAAYLAATSGQAEKPPHGEGAK